MNEEQLREIEDFLNRLSDTDGMTTKLLQTNVEGLRKLTLTFVGRVRELQGEVERALRLNLLFLKLANGCDLHKSYRAMKPPRTNSPRCHELWDLKTRSGGDTND